MIIAGLDVAFSNDYMALVIVEKTSDEKVKLVHLATWRKIDWHLWKQDMKAKQSKFNIDWIYIDQTNNQSVVMELEEIGMNVEGVSFTNSSKLDMIRNATKLMVTGELVMPVVAKLDSARQKKLAEELITQLYEQEYAHESANVRLTHPQGRHDDLLWALCLALYGMSMKWSNVVPFIMSFDYDPERSSYYDNEIMDRTSGRFKNTGIKFTDVKIKRPGQDWKDL